MKKIPRDWTFESDSVASEFDEHVREQLPWYDLATKAVGLIGRHYIPAGGLVYDLGASTGNIGIELADTLQARNADLIAIESAREMAKRYRGPGRLLCANAGEVIFQDFDLAVCFLFFMFVPLRERRGLLERLMSKLRNGGAVIIVDKTQFDGHPGVIMHRLTIMGKTLEAVPPGEIIEKELALAGVQRPIDPHDLFCGYRALEWFRFGEFAGWLIEK